MAKSDLAEARAELSRERKRRVVAPSSPVKPQTPTKSSAIDDAVASQGPASPLFSDDNGAVSPPEVRYSHLLDSEARPSAVEARQRGHRGHACDLELLRENAASDKQERQREVKRLRDRANESDEGAPGGARRGEARRVAGERCGGEGCRAAGPAGAGAVRRRGTRVKQLTKAIRELTRKNDELRRQRDEARAELARLQTEEPPLSASKELRSLKAQLAARDAKRAANPPPPPDRCLAAAAARRCVEGARGAGAEGAGAPGAASPENFTRRASEGKSGRTDASSCNGCFCHCPLILHNWKSGASGTGSSRRPAIAYELDRPNGARGRRSRRDSRSKVAYARSSAAPAHQSTRSELG